MRVESTLGKGSTFTIELYLERVERYDLEETRGEDAGSDNILDHKKVLLVEDGGVNSILDLLESWGMVVVRFQDIRDTIDHILYTQPTTRYDYIIFDSFYLTESEKFFLKKIDGYLKKMNRRLLRS